MEPHKRKLLGQILTEMGHLREPELAEALEHQRAQKKRIGQVLIELGTVQEEEVAQALSAQLLLPFWPQINHIDIEVASRVPIHFVRVAHLLPIKRDADGIIVALSDPLNLAALDDLRLIFPEALKPVIVTPKALWEAINLFLQQSKNRPQQVIEDLDYGDLSLLASSLEEAVDLLEASDEAPVIRLVNSLLIQAAKERASDIHLEPFEKDVMIRYRIDGVLHNRVSLPKALQPNITSRVKIMAGLDIAEKRLPQDGRITIKVAGRDIDIRVSVVPTSFGERVVLRLLDKSNLLMNLEELGFSPATLKVIYRLIKMSHGIILVSGPTGSGKTTTLYAGLNRINSPDKNIITIEDPVEYQLRGIGQIQVNPKINLTFANGLRSILRQDPDVVMVGEIRDVETAEIAIHASLTGHLVFSTLHTNDAPGAITRLIDMGIEPYLVSSAVVAILAQRLVRLVCPACNSSYRPAAEELKELGINHEDLPAGVVHRGRGCPECSDTGYQGRTAIYELLLIDEGIRELILKNADSNTIRNRAISQGMATMRTEGAKKVVQGLTTIEEVFRVTQEEIINGGL